jgi:HEPN domain-containing protein
MNEPDGEVDRDRWLVARRWHAVAERDARAAILCLESAEPVPEVAAYLCQQAVEKLLKGLLVLVDTPFRRTHDLEVLRDLVAPRYPHLTDLIQSLLPASDWGHVFRYPEMTEEGRPSVEELRVTLNDIHALSAYFRSVVDPAPLP